MSDEAPPRAETERKIAGALRDVIDAHGPLTKRQIGSASKRIYGALYGNPERARTPKLVSTPKTNRDELPELRLDGKAVILRRGDLVKVKPSRPRKRDGWVGKIVSIFSDAGGVTVEVTHPGSAARYVSASRIKGRKNPSTSQSERKESA